MSGSDDGTPIAERTVSALLGRVASRDPAPGGGAVTGVSAALAAALAGMAARFSDAELDSEATTLAARADELRGEAVRLAQDDVDAYGEFLARSRAGEDADRRRAALSRATDVPLAIAAVAAEVAELAARIVDHGNPNLRGDAITGLVIAEAAASAAVTLVGLNARHGGFDDDRPGEAERLAARARAARARIEEGSS